MSTPVTTIPLLAYTPPAVNAAGQVALVLHAEGRLLKLTGAEAMFLDLAHDEARRTGRLRTREDLVEAIIHGAVKRVRPKAMTVSAAMLGLLPIMWSTGLGADLMKRVAAPMVGGLVTSFLLELIVYPAIYFLWRGRERDRAQGVGSAEAPRQVA